MQSLNRDLAYLWDMREAALWIMSFVQEATFVQYNEDKKLQSAVERQFEVIGEAARRVSAEFQAEHPEIPWRSVIGLRNLLIHEYGEVKAERIWGIATTNVGKLVESLNSLIPAEKED